MSIPKKYLPRSLSNKDKKTQEKELKKSRKLYKQKKYHSRPKINSFKSKKSKHVINAINMYNVENISPSFKLAKATGCSVEGLKKIVKKGQGAYYSSGSRPSQTAHSWGNARLASAITGGKACKVDYHVLEEHCESNSKALKLANDFIKKNSKLRKVAKVKKMRGGKNSSKNKLVKPYRKSDTGRLHFSDYPDFKPNLTPKQIFQKGSFGGTYFRPIYCTVNKKHYKNFHKKYPVDWFKGLKDDQLTRDYEDYDIKVNKYKVKVGLTLQDWQNYGWINKLHPYGWVNWYCDFYMGKRSNDDDRQVQRWINMKRFIIPLVKEIKEKNANFDDPEISPGRRQTLQHWGFELLEKDYHFYLSKKSNEKKEKKEKEEKEEKKNKKKKSTEKKKKGNKITSSMFDIF